MIMPTFKKELPLLARVSGLSGTVAKSVVRWREAHGAFKSRQDLLKVTGLGAKTFEQSAGFLRIRGGDNPLDMTGVHPETYPVVEQIIVRTGKPVTGIMGHADVLRALRPEQFARFAVWAPEARGELTIFAHGLSGDDLADHTRYVVWFGASEPLDLSIFN